MEKQAIIKVEDVSMKFNLSSEKFDSFKEYVIKRLKKQVKFDEFWALKNVSFEVYKGESLGLIGLNGSGKSTMLKTIAGVLKPTTGKVEVCGTVAPLIELLDTEEKRWKSITIILWNSQNSRILWMFRSKTFLQVWCQGLRLQLRRSGHRTY